MDAPFSWMGGKSELAAKIVAMMPRHQIYVEPYFGSGAVFFKKNAAPVEIINDKDLNVVSFFRVLRDETMFARFYEQIRLIPFSRSEISRYYDALKCPAGDPVERAIAFFVVARQCFGSNVRPNSQAGWGYTITQVSGGTSGSVHRFQESISKLPDIRERLLRTQIECDDGLAVLGRFDTPNTLGYLDPPYHPDTRTHGTYWHELKEGQHTQLVDFLLDASGKYLLSGYRCTEYERLEAAGWQRADFELDCSVVPRTRESGLQGTGACAGKEHKRIDCVWSSPNIKEAKKLL